MRWWDEAVKSPEMVLVSWLESCSGTEISSTSLLCLPQLHKVKDRRLSSVTWPSNECSVEFHLLIAFILGLSWIFVSLCHVSTFALFLRNAEVQCGAAVAVFTVPKH